MDKLKEFEEAKSKYDNAKENYALAEKIVKQTKAELRKVTLEFKEWLAKFEGELCEELRPTLKTAIVEILEKDPPPEKPLITIGQRYEEKYKPKTDKISPEEKEIFASKIKPQLLKIDVEDLKKIGLTREAVRNWFAKGSNPSKQNYDKLVAYFGIN